jgi:hypothetical protein
MKADVAAVESSKHDDRAIPNRNFLDVRAPACFPRPTSLTRSLLPLKRRIWLAMLRKKLGLNDITLVSKLRFVMFLILSIIMNFETFLGVST